jgi:hypothetical protein
MEVYVMGADGSSPTRVTNDAGADIEPAWSADGSSLLFTSDRDGENEVFVANADGSEPVPLTENTALDGLADWAVGVDTVGLVDPVTGEWRLRDPSGAVTAFFYGNPGDIPFMGDWDCDGVDTPGLYRQSDGFVYLRNSNTQGIADIRFFYGNPADVPIAGDFDGDGCDSLSIYRPSEQLFYIINKLGANEGGLGFAEFSFMFGNPGDKPFAGDFDGDGIDEVGLHRETTGLVYFRHTLTTGIADNAFIFGNPGDRFVGGDWGVIDGTETPGLFRPANTTFFFRHSNTQGNAESQFVWGEAPWLPVSGMFGVD